MEFTFWTILFLITYSLFGYLAVIRIMSKISRKKRLCDETYLPDVSMVISAYNEEKVIEKKIRNFLEIDYPEEKIRLFIGSDGSNDGTNEILKRYEGEKIKISLYEQRRGKTAVLNNLIPQTEGSIIIFSDADTFYQPDAVKKIVRHFADKNVGAVCGRLILSNPDEKNVGGWGEKIYWVYENKIKQIEGIIKTTIGATGGIYAIRKSLFNKVPENKNIACDFFTPVKIAGSGFDVIYEGEAKAAEKTAMSIRKEFSRKIRIGVQNFRVIPMLVPYLNPLKGFIAFGLWSHKIIRWFTPFLLISLFVINVLLADKPFYKAVLIVQAVFLIFTLIGFILQFFGKKMFIFSAPFYYITINAALFIAFFKSIFTTQKPTWETNERQL